jgi:hypothetical protein
VSATDSVFGCCFVTDDGRFVFVLCFSRIPAIHALGVAVFLVTMLGAIACYLLLPQISLKKEVAHAL